MDSKELGRLVSQRRKEMGLSQEALADQSGISRNYVSLIERGEARNVSVKVLHQLATALDTTPSELSGESGWANTLVPPALRDFARQRKLSFDIVDRLARIPRRGQEPKTAEEWSKLYENIHPYLEESDQ